LIHNQTDASCTTSLFM